jgi:hypothetical protein
LRQLNAAEYLSVDGRMEDPGPGGDSEHRGWTMPYWNDELATYQSDLLFASDAPLLGRATYEEFAAAWPSRSGDSFTDRMNSLPKFVASRTSHEPLTWNATLLKGDVAEEFGGRRFFGDGGDKIRLTLTSAKTTSTGVAVLTYQPAH